MRTRGRTRERSAGEEDTDMDMAGASESNRPGSFLVVSC